MAAFSSSSHVTKSDQHKTSDMFSDSSISTSRSNSTLIPIRQQEVSPEQLQFFILEALCFKSMTERQEEVASAHAKTFEWVLSPPPQELSSQVSFYSWLRDPAGGIYWINGKPGSGKSTLLRFIYDHASTTRELAAWGGSKPVTKAGFFFWTSGSLEQRSQMGLLQSLLWQVLDANQDLIVATFPELWENYRWMSTKERIKSPIIWTLEMLMKGLRSFLHRAVKRTKVCLFVDGLDEFDGDHAEIIDLFKEVAHIGGADVKLCLSSRPWGVFMEAFESVVPSLKLQDLTLTDRRTYVNDKLLSDTKTKMLLEQNSAEAQQFLDQVVERADGVFLWVILAVRLILDDVTPTSTLLDLTNILRLLPTDLEDLFAYVLFEKQKHEAKTQVSQIFQLIRAREIVCDFIKDSDYASVTLREMALAFSVFDNSVLESPVVEADTTVFTELVSTSKTIDATTSGLLETHFKSGGSVLESMAEAKITYLHRTVRDWLIYSPDTWANVVPFNPNYDPHLAHLRSHILSLRRPLKMEIPHRRWLDWWPGIILSLTHARHISPTSPPELAHSLIDALESTLSASYLHKSTQAQDHWARNAFGSYEERSKLNAPISHPFLSLCTKFGLEKYVVSKLSSLEYHGGKPLLGYATEFLVNRKHTVFPLSSPTFVRALLKEQNPNSVYLNFSKRKENPWVEVLKLVRQALRRNFIEDSEVGRWTEILKAFVEAGANVEAVILADAWDPEISAMGVVDAVLEQFELEELRSVRTLMAERLDGIGKP